MNIKFLIPLLLFFLLFGCTSQDILLVRQTIGADINGFFDGNYDGAVPFVDVNRIVFDKDFNFYDNIFYAPVIAGDLNWVYLSNYPDACPSGTAVQSIGDTLGCVALSDTNGFVTWIDANATFATITSLQDLNLDLIDLNTYVYNLTFDENYLRLDTNNDPLTGNLEILKTDPEIRLTYDNSNDYYTRFYRTGSNVSYLKSQVEVQGGQSNGLQHEKSTTTTGSMGGGQALTPDGNISISVWWKPEVLNTSNIVMRGASTVNESGEPQIFYYAGDLYFRVGLGTIQDTTNTYVAGNWYHIVATAERDDVAGETLMKLYINGSLIGTRTTTNATQQVSKTSTNPFRLGYFWNSQDQVVDEMLITTDILEQADVTSIYNGGTGREENPSDYAGIIGLYHFNESSGLTASDASSNGNDWTLLTGSGAWNWVTGHVPSSASVEEVEVLKVADGVTSLAEGEITLGNDTADTIINGGNISIRSGGTEYWNFNSLGDLIAENNSNLRLQSDTAKITLGLDDDWEIYTGGTSLVIDRPVADSYVHILGGDLLFGTNTSPTLTSSPDYIDLGGTYGNSNAGRWGNLKLLLYNSTTNKYGLGISGGTFEYQAGGAGEHVFYTQSSASSSNEAVRITTSGDVNMQQDLNVYGTVYYNALQSMSPHAFLDDASGYTTICKRATDGAIVYETIQKIGGVYQTVIVEDTTGKCSKTVLKDRYTDTNYYVVEGTPKKVTEITSVYQEIWTKETSFNKEEIYSELPVYDLNYSYEVGDLFVYENELYEVIQAHTSQSEWLPNLVPALYKVRVLQEYGEVRAWVQPLGASDCYAIGDKVTYNGNTWENQVTCNVWTPGVYGWVIV